MIGGPGRRVGPGAGGRRRAARSRSSSSTRHELPRGRVRGVPRHLPVQRPPAPARSTRSGRTSTARPTAATVRGSSRCRPKHERQPLDALALPRRADPGARLGGGGLPRRAPVAGLADGRGRREPPGGPRVRTRARVLWARCVPGWGAALGPLEPARDHAASARTAGSATATAGVYWLLASALPGFRSFRYPAKFLVFTALAVSGLAGAGWDRLVAGRSRRAEVVAGGLLAASLTALAAAWLGAGCVAGLVRRPGRATRSGYGPLDVERAIADLRAALRPGALAFAAAPGARGVRRRVARASPGLLAVGGAGARPGPGERPARRDGPAIGLRGDSAGPGDDREAERADPVAGPVPRPAGGRLVARALVRARLSPRIEEITRWERDTLRPNYQLPLGCPLDVRLRHDRDARLRPLLLPVDDRPSTRAARGPGLKPGQKVWYYPRRGFDLWNTRYFIVPGYLVWDSRSAATRRSSRGPRRLPAARRLRRPRRPGASERWGATDDVRVLRNEAAYPRAWVVHRARVFPPVRGLRLSDRRKLMQEILYPGRRVLARCRRSPVRDPRAPRLGRDRPARRGRPLLSRGRARPGRDRDGHPRRPPARRADGRAPLARPGRRWPTSITPAGP